MLAVRSIFIVPKHSINPTSRRQRRKDEVRERLYRAALRLFRSRGYDATTVQDVVDLADTSKATFFAYFPTKEHVLVAYHQEMGEHIFAQISARQYATASEAIQDALRECAAWVVDDPPMGRLLIRVMFGSDILMHSDESNSERLGAWLHAQIAHGRKRGEFRRSLDIPLFLSLVMGTLNSTVIEWTSGDRAFDLEGRIQKKVRFLIEAAST